MMSSSVHCDNTLGVTVFCHFVLYDLTTALISMH